MEKLYDNRPGGPAGKEDDSLELLVVEEVVEGPDTSLLSIRVRAQVRVVTTRSKRMGLDYYVL